MSNKVRTLVIKFNNELTPNEVSFFRGAIINTMKNANILFHNHLEDGKSNYSYPLIQYKRIHQKAAIVCIGDGVDAIGDFFSSSKFDVAIGSRKTVLEVETFNANQILVQIWKSEFTYRIHKWMPLNQENYEKYIAYESVVERYAMLERLLTGNILSFAKGVCIRFNEQVKCKIKTIEEPHITPFKNVKMMTFDAEFKTNVSLPNYIGLGKGVSLGMGTVVRKYDNNKNDNNE